MPALTVRVIRGKVVPNTASSSVDSFASIFVATAADPTTKIGEIKRTHTFKGSLDPAWNTTLTWELTEQQLRTDLVLVCDLFTVSNGQEENVGKVTFEIPYISMVIAGKTRKATKANGADGGGLTVEIKKKTAQITAEPAAPLPLVELPISEEDMKGATVAATLKENEVFDMASFLPSTVTQPPAHSNITTSVSAFKQLGAGSHLGKYSVKVNIKTYGFGFQGPKVNMAFHFTMSTIKSGNILYFKALSWDTVEINGGMPGVRLSHVNVLSAPRVPKASPDVDPCDISVQLCWNEGTEKKSLFVELMSDNSCVSTDRPHDGWSPVRSKSGTL